MAQRKSNCQMKLNFLVKCFEREICWKFSNQRCGWTVTKVSAKKENCKFDTDGQPRSSSMGRKHVMSEANDRCMVKEMSSKNKRLNLEEESQTNMEATGQSLENFKGIVAWWDSWDD